MAESKLKSSILSSLETLTKSTTALHETVKSFDERLKALETRAKAESDSEDKPEPDADENAGTEPDSDDESNKAGEDARSDIAGEEPARDQPEGADSENSNQDSVFKAMNDRINALEKSVASRSGPAPRAGPSEVRKADNTSDVDPVALAMGVGKKVNWQAVHKAEGGIR